MRRLFAVLASLAVSAWAEQPPAVSILEKRCLGCHTGQLKKSGLDLSRRDLAIRGGDRGPALVPGNSKESLIIKVASHAAEPHMPWKVAKLPDAELAALAEWIDQGASYEQVAKVSATGAGLPPLPDHWSFRIPKRSAVPPVSKPFR